MFAFKQTTRRLLCRWGFVLLCALPTLGVLTAVAMKGTTPRRELDQTRWQSLLSRRLGLQVTIESIEQPDAKRTIFHNVRLDDPETGLRLAAAVRVEMLETPQGQVLLLAGARLHGRHLHRLWEALHHRLLRDAVSPPIRIQATADELHLTDNNTFSPLRGVRLLLTTTAETGEAELEFRLAGSASSEPVRLRAVRRRKQQTTRWELHTANEQLPCAMLADFLPLLSGLGRECRFHGAIWAEQLADGWQGDVAGRFFRLDMNRLVSRRFPHVLDTTADLELKRCRFAGGRLVDAAGSLTCREGTVSRSLLAAAADQFKLRFGGAATQDRFAFRQLALGFMLDAGGLSITGHADRLGTIVFGEEGPLLSEASIQRVEAAALLRTLVPTDDALTPADQRTDFLLRILPAAASPGTAGASLDNRPDALR